MRGNKALMSFFLILPLLLLGAGCSKGEGLSLGGPKDCGSDAECFEERFKDCKPTIRLARVTNDIEYRYEIIGLKDGKCEVKQTFTDNPAPLLVGIDGFCLYDNSKSFAEASFEIMSSGNNLPNYCQGPLIDELYRMGQPK